MPRRVYGDYVRSLALQHARPLDGRSLVETRLVEAEAVDVEPHGSGARVVLADGQGLPADQVVLATGNETPAELPGSDDLLDHPGYAANPWVDWESRLPDPSEAIVLLGTGLTAVDAILTLLALDWRGKIVAVSRHGWLPNAHFKGRQHPEFPPDGVEVASLGHARLAALVEEACARMRAAGENPAIIVDKLRPHTQRVWQALTPEERRTFVAQYAARWSVLRHRIAQPIHERVHLLEAQRVRVQQVQEDRVEQDARHLRRRRVRADSGSQVQPGLKVCCRPACLIRHL